MGTDTIRKRMYFFKFHMLYALYFLPAGLEKGIVLEGTLVICNDPEPHPTPFIPCGSLNERIFSLQHTMAFLFAFSPSVEFSNIPEADGNAATEHRSMEKKSAILRYAPEDRIYRLSQHSKSRGP